MADDGGDGSSDECLLCGALYAGESGWPLCDSPGCGNVVCARCVTVTELSVGDLFYCPGCAGAGESAAAVAGGALTAATLGLVDLARMPKSLKALRRVVANVREPDPRYRRLRLANPGVRRALDVPPARRCLATLGFVERDESGEPVLTCDAVPDAETVEDVARLLEGLDDDDVGDERGGDGGSGAAPADAPAKPPAPPPPPAKRPSRLLEGLGDVGDERGRDGGSGAPPAEPPAPPPPPAKRDREASPSPPAKRPALS